MMLVFLLVVCIPKISDPQFSDGIKCQVNGVVTFYCSGEESELYLYISYIIIGLLCPYLACVAYGLFWIWFPYFRPGSLSCLLRRLKKEMKPLTKDRPTLFDMKDMYFRNADVRMFIDLLATSCGVAPSIKLLGLFDAEFKKLIEADDLKVHCSVVNKDQINCEVSFQEPKMIRSILEHIRSPKCIYTVEISPPIESVSIYK